MQDARRMITQILPLAIWALLEAALVVLALCRRRKMPGPLQILERPSEDAVLAKDDLDELLQHISQEKDRRKRRQFERELRRSWLAASPALHREVLSMKSTMNCVLWYLGRDYAESKRKGGEMTERRERLLSNAGEIKQAFETVAAYRDLVARTSLAMACLFLVVRVDRLMLAPVPELIAWCLRAVDEALDQHQEAHEQILIYLAICHGRPDQ